MSEEKKKSSETVTLYNRGRGTFRTAHGVVRPGEAIDVPVEEAKQYLGYSELIDASKIVKGKGGDTQALQAKVAELEKSNDELAKQNAKLSKELEKASKGK